MTYFKTKLAALLGGLLALVGCSGAALLNNVIVPHSGYTLHEGIAYGGDARQQLDVYVPDNLAKPAGVILFFYGGSWQSGSKSSYRFAGQAFASRGYIAVIADYRIYPDVYFPDFMHDSAQALAWVHTHIGEYGGDPQQLFVAGHSAGAYNAVMLTVNDSYIKAAGGSRSWIKGTIGLAGPYDFLPFTDPKIIALFSHAKDKDTQPINFVKPGAPPILLLTGDADTEVLPRNSKNLAAKLEKAHDKVSVHIYPDIAHIGIVLALANGFRGKAPVLDDIDTFIKEQAK